MEKLTISRCTVSGGTITPTQEKFRVMLNPSGFTHAHQIAYSEEESLGISAAQPKFDKYNSEKINFHVLIDSTGVVAPSTLPDVPTQLEKLKAIVYQYVGEKHEPSVVNILWGTYTFYGRLTSMSVEYTLFKPSGEPLRAKVTLEFVSYMTKAEEALRAKRSSPDLSHIVDVRAGDTLPLLCYRIYRDSSYYLDVAKLNNLSGFRNLEPGARLYFPPLR